jgi:hypothetical protein
MFDRLSLVMASRLMWISIATWTLWASAASAQRTNPNPTPNPATVSIPALTPTRILKPSPAVNPIPATTPASGASPKPNPIASPDSSVVIPPPPPPPPKKSREIPNNPLEAPQDIDRILSTRMSADEWALMYQPLSCLDTSVECVQALQTEAVQNNPIIKGIELKIQEINQRIEEAKTNNKKSIDLSIFEPGLQALLKKETIVENGQVRTIGFFERIGQLFTNPGAVMNDLLGAVGIPILRGSFGGNDAQQSKTIAISELTIKVAEMERGKTDVTTKTKEKIQQLVLDFDAAAREFQAEQAIVVSQKRSLKIYSVTYAAGDGDTNTYLNRKEQLEKSKLQMFKNWAKLRSHISHLKNIVLAKE